MKEEEERKKKIGKSRHGNMARPCQYWHGPCQPSGNGGFGLEYSGTAVPLQAWVVPRFWSS